MDILATQLSQHLDTPSPHLKMIVTVPVRDEEHFIQHLLHSLTNQRTKQEDLFPTDLFEILLLCNNCTDRSYELCREFHKIDPSISIQVLETKNGEITNVGAARRLLLKVASQRLADPNGFLILTDADCVADPYWLSSIYQHYTEPVQLLCGSIHYDPTGLSEIEKAILEAKTRYQSLLCHCESELFPDANDPWPRHNQNFGPNLSIRKSMYEAIGGIPAIPFLEDVRLFESVHIHAGVVRHCNQTIVTTSTRRESSAQGFSNEIKTWSEYNSIYGQYLVPGKEELHQKYNAFQFVKINYNTLTSSDITFVASSLCMRDEEVLKIYQNSISHRDMIIQLDHLILVTKKWKDRFPLVDVWQAIQELEESLMLELA